MESQNRSTGTAKTQKSDASTLSRVEQAVPTTFNNAGGLPPTDSKVDPFVDPTLKSKEDNLKPLDVYDTITRAATFKAAALLIALPNFPQADQLPRIATLPFVNLGNLVLFDYSTFGRIIWTLALKIKGFRQECRRKIFQVFLASLVFSGIAVSFIPIFALSQLGLRITWSAVEQTAIVAMFAFASTMITAPFRLRKLANTTTKLRLEYLSKLLANQSPPDSDPLDRSEASWIKWGDGRIGGRNVPVLIASGEHKFPGFGQPQIHQILVCQPRQRKAFAKSPSIVPKKHLANDLAPIIHRSILDSLAGSNFPNTMTGSVIVVDGASITKDSPWLDDQGRPLLRVSQDDLPRLKASLTPAREYWAIQILFADQMTTATLFIRYFAAGHAAAVEINLLSLGPIAASDKYLQDQLQSLRLRINRESQDSTHQSSKARASIYVRSLRTILDGTRKASQTIANDLDLGIGRIPDPNFPAEQRALAKDARALQANLTFWVGNWPFLPNWREEHSLAITNDCFGNPEVSATIRSLYETVTGAILDELDNRGFDVSNYRNREGRTNIQADNIDHFAMHDESRIREFDRVKPINRGTTSEKVESRKKYPRKIFRKNIPEKYLD